MEAFQDGLPGTITQEDKILFSGYLRNRPIEDKNELITNAIFYQIPNIIAPYQRLTVLEKIHKYVCFLAESSVHIGQEVEIDGADHTRFFCKNTEELVKIIEYLEQKLLIEVNHEVGRIGGKTVLTVDGWEKYEKLKEINLDSKKVFIAMNFDSVLKPVFDDAIYPACEECGFKAIRIDKEEHNEKICDKIIAGIKESKFLIADFTGQKQGVYFEAGYAYGLSIPVIWTCRRGEETELHFDTRQYNHIIWDDVDAFKIQLIDRIKATIKWRKNGSHI